MIEWHWSGVLLWHRTEVKYYVRMWPEDDFGYEFTVETQFASGSPTVQYSAFVGVHGEISFQPVAGSRGFPYRDYYSEAMITPAKNRIATYLLFELQRPEDARRVLDKLKEEREVDSLPPPY